MRMKSVLAASTALAMLATTANAQAGDLYVSVFGGLNNVINSSGITDDGESGGWSSDADTGFVVGGAIGTGLDKWVKGLRVEVEASYRRNDLGGVWSEPTETETGVLAGNLSTFAIMANAWYEFDVGSAAKPYIGGGIGWGRFKGEMLALYSSTTDTTDSNEDSGFAWQLGAGFRYEVAPAVELGLGYRYFHGPNYDGFFEGISSLDNDSHTIQVELSIGVN